MRKFLVIIGFLLLFSLPVNANSAAAKIFKDVPLESSHYPGIYMLSDEYIIKGYDDNTFRPSKNVTKAQAATMVFRALKLSSLEKYSHTYADVSPSHSAYHEIHTLMEMGIFPKNKNFFPTAPLKREAMASLISLSFELDGQKKFTFPDVKKSEANYKHINNLANYSITTNHTNVKFNPKGNVTRAQFSSFLSRALPLKYKYLKVVFTTDFDDVLLTEDWRVKIVSEKNGKYLFTDGYSDDPIYELEKEKFYDHVFYNPSITYLEHYLNSFTGIEEIIENGINERSIGEFIIEGDFNVQKFPSIGKVLNVQPIDFGSYNLHATSTIDTLTKLYFNKTLPRTNAPLQMEYNEQYPVYKYTSKGYYLLFGDKGSYPMTYSVLVTYSKRTDDGLDLLVNYTRRYVDRETISYVDDGNFTAEFRFADSSQPYIYKLYRN